MDALEPVIKPLIGTLLGILSAGSLLNWLHLCSALAIVLLIYWLRDRDRPSFHRLLRFCFPARVWLHRSAILDYKFFLINIVLFSLLVAPLLLSSATVTHATWITLQTLFGTEGPGLRGGPQHPSVEASCDTLQCIVGKLCQWHLNCCRPK